MKFFSRIIPRSLLRNVSKAYFEDSYPCLKQVESYHEGGQISRQVISIIIAVTIYLNNKKRFGDLDKTMSMGCSKMFRCKARKKLNREAYNLKVTRIKIR